MRWNRFSKVFAPGPLSAILIPALCAACLCAAGLLMSGCQNVMGSSARSQVRVIDASSNAPAVDVYAGSDLIATNVGSPTIGNYAIINSSSMRTIHVDPQGTKTIGAQTAGSFLGNESHSVYITDVGTGYGATVLTDQSTPAPSGQIAIRFLQSAPLSGLLDIYLVPSGSKFTGVKPVVSALTAGSITAYIGLPAGTYDVVVVPTGTTTASYTSGDIAFTDGEVDTALIVDQPVLSNPPINVIIGADHL
jgi:Domain of unknown function (DUF4397)